MLDAALSTATELTAEECEQISGGSPIQYAVFFVACFKAGFYYGYTELGPALLGDE